MRKVLAPLLFLAFACAPAGPQAPAVAPAAPRLAATSVARRVVLLSFDGLGADALARQRSLPGFESMVRDGAAARVIPVNPTVTSTTHVSILTGAQPQRHGIVSNRFHLPGTPPEVTTRGMEAPISVETLVMAAHRQGKRVGVVLFPSVDGTRPERSADFGMVWTMPLNRGKIVKLSRGDFRRDWVPPTWTQRPQRHPSYSPVMRARVEWVAPGIPRADVHVIAYDTTDDGAENYDLLAVEGDEGELTPDAHGWFPVSRRTTAGVAGSWSKILTATPSLDVTIYWGAISRTNAYPASYRDFLDREAGFWPGEPDESADLDPQAFEEQLERLAAFITRAQTSTIRTMPFDLLLAYQPEVDGAQHNFLGYDDSVVSRSFVMADQAVQSIRALLDPATDALVVTGDHGLVGFDHEIHLNRWLVENGLAPRWRAYTSGTLAHLYRFAGPDDTDAVVQRLNATGWFEAIEKKTAASHPNTGDIMAIGRPDFEMSPSSEAPVVAEPSSYGHHGSLNIHRELHSVLFAAGAGVPRGSFGEISQTKIARFVSGLLGIEPPSSAE
jgi:hypothetical protein